MVNRFSWFWPLFSALAPSTSPWTLTSPRPPTLTSARHLFTNSEGKMVSKIRHSCSVDHVHDQVGHGSIHQIIPPTAMNPYLGQMLWKRSTQNLLVLWGDGWPNPEIRNGFPEEELFTAVIWKITRNKSGEERQEKELLWLMNKWWVMNKNQVGGRPRQGDKANQWAGTRPARPGQAMLKMLLVSWK